MLMVTSTLVSLVSLFTRPLRSTGAAASEVWAVQYDNAVKHVLQEARDRARASTSAYQPALCQHHSPVSERCQAELE